MRFAHPLVPGRLLQRYNRFLADVALDDGQVVTAHCPNPGSMMGLATPGNRVFLAPATAPGRKLPYSWQVVEADVGRGPELIGIDTGHPNRLVAEGIAAGHFPALTGYAFLQREVKYGTNSRVDMVLTDPARPPCYVEVKNVHLMRTPGLAEFPDCVTARGAKHLDELAAMVAQGNRACMVYLIQMAAEAFDLAADLDPTYAKRFSAARAAGVEAIAVTCHVTLEGVGLAHEVPIRTR